MATTKKNKPDFREAMVRRPIATDVGGLITLPKTAEQRKMMYEDFLSEMKKQYAPEKIQDGQVSRRAVASTPQA